jgi:hypothetical protein
MARLFIRHQPIDCEVDPSVEDGVFYVHRSVLYDHGILITRYSHMYAYICFAHEGKCWAARASKEMGNKQVRLECAPFDDDPSAQEMILADMILN